MKVFCWKLQSLLCAAQFLLLCITASSGQRFGRKYVPLSELSYPKMRWPEGMTGIDDFDVSFDSLDDNETQEHFFEAFEELSPEIQDTILYFYDENLKLAEQKMQLSYVVDYLLKVFPIKVDIYIQQQPMSNNPYNYNQYQQFPLMGPGPSSFYPQAQNPYGFGYPSVQLELPMGFGLAERDKRISMQPRKFYRFQDIVKESKNGEHIPEESGSSDNEKQDKQFGVEQIVLLFLLEQCSENYIETNQMLPACVIFINTILEAMDKIKLGESVERINLGRSMSFTS